MVQISSQTGIAKSIGIRFIVLLDAGSARVFIPNRTISNVLIYPRGYLRCYVDVTISKQAEKAALMVERIIALTAAAAEQYNGAMREGYDVGAPQATAAGRVFVRVKLRIWPGCSAPFDGLFRQELLSEMAALEPGYQDWMITVGVEMAEKPVDVGPWRRVRAARR